MAEGSISAFKDTPLLFLMYLHAVELLYKHNITLLAVQYGYISAHCDYLRPNHSHANIQPYLMATRVILLI